jgi:hypothetical protein
LIAGELDEDDPEARAAFAAAPGLREEWAVIKRLGRELDGVTRIGPEELRAALAAVRPEDRRRVREAALRAGLGRPRLSRAAFGAWLAAAALVVLGLSMVLRGAVWREDRGRDQPLGAQAVLEPDGPIERLEAFHVRFLQPRAIAGGSLRVRVYDAAWSEPPLWESELFEGEVLRPDAEVLARLNALDDIRWRAYEVSGFGDEKLVGQAEAPLLSR